MARALKYRDVLTILQNLGLTPAKQRATSHQTFFLKRHGKIWAVTLAFHGANKEIPKGTLASIIRQSGFSREEFFKALKKKL